MSIRPEQRLKRERLKELGWINPGRLDDMVFSSGREPMDRHVPLYYGQYRMYHQNDYPRIRIMKVSGECYYTIYVGICNNEATLNYLTGLLEIKDYDTY